MASLAVLAGGSGVLESLPDRHDRAGVRVAGARLVLPTEKVSAAANSPQPRRSQPREPAGGRLRGAVREHLIHSPYVVEVRAGDAEAVGDGVTLAHIAR